MDPQLQYSVGAAGRNLATDILKVQMLLNLVPAAKWGASPKLTSFGQDTEELRRAIRTFQSHNTPFRDGKIDPGGPTWKALLAAATQALAGAPFPPLPQPLPAPPKPPADSNLLTLIDTPTWGDWGFRDLPLLANTLTVRNDWEMNFGGPPGGSVKTLAFQAKEGAGVRYIGAALPSGCTRPKAYLIYFRHSASGTDYPGGKDVLEKGIVDYLVGRMQIAKQVGASGKDVAALVPMARPGVGLNEFTSNQTFVSECLAEIDKTITGAERELPPILLASYSDGLGPMHDFLNACKNLRQKVRAIYDMDGLLVVRYRGITLTDVTGAQVFRYVGSSSPPLGPKQDKQAYIVRCMSQHPGIVPLPYSRWVNYGPHLADAVPGDNTAHTWWLHYFIPACMLQHGLENTAVL